MMIEKILERLEVLHDLVKDNQKLAVSQAIKIVQEVAKEYGKDTNVRSNGWIPCSEQFPKKYAYVLVCDREGDIYIASMYENEIFGKVWRQWNGGELREDWVIAWQPLPAPYQKGE